MRSRLAELKKELEHAKELVEHQEVRLAEVRRLQTELKQKSEQLKALATLALKHLEDRCPVCAQVYDREAARKRLEKLARGADQRIQDPPADTLSQLLGGLEAKRKELSAAEQAIRIT